MPNQNARRRGYGKGHFQNSKSLDQEVSECQNSINFPSGSSASYPSQNPFINFNNSKSQSTQMLLVPQPSSLNNHNDIPNKSTHNNAITTARITSSEKGNSHNQSYNHHSRHFHRQRGGKGNSVNQKGSGRNEVVSNKIKKSKNQSQNAEKKSLPTEPVQTSNVKVDNVTSSSLTAPVVMEPIIKQPLINSELSKNSSELANESNKTVDNNKKPKAKGYWHQRRAAAKAKNKQWKKDTCLQNVVEKVASGNGGPYVATPVTDNPSLEVGNNTEGRASQNILKKPFPVNNNPQGEIQKPTSSPKKDSKSKAHPGPGKAAEDSNCTRNPHKPKYFKHSDRRRFQNSNQTIQPPISKSIPILPNKILLRKIPLSPENKDNPPGQQVGQSPNNRKGTHHIKPDHNQNSHKNHWNKTSFGSDKKRNFKIDKHLSSGAPRPRVLGYSFNKHLSDSEDTNKGSREGGTGLSELGDENDSGCSDSYCNDDEGPPSTKPLTKVTVRLLPPSLTRKQFITRVGPLAPHNYFAMQHPDPEFGSNSKGVSTVWINFLSPQDASNFIAKVQGTEFSGKSTRRTYFPHAEFSEIQRVLKSRKTNPLRGTLNDDPDFQAFMEQYNFKAQIEKQALTPSITTEQMTWELHKKDQEKAGKSTPLIDYLMENNNKVTYF